MLGRRPIVLAAGTFCAGIGATGPGTHGDSGRRTRMHLTQGLQRAAQTKSTAISTIFRDRRRTWRDTAERIARLAGGLRRRGLGKGDRVAILALNSDRYFELLFAVP